MTLRKANLRARRRKFEASRSDEWRRHAGIMRDALRMAGIRPTRLGVHGLVLEARSYARAGGERW